VRSRGRRCDYWKMEGWAIVALDALETGEAGVPFIGADGESNGRKRMGHRWW
jgi:hypothetical protein